MIIKKKVDIKFFLVDFVDYAEWDGNKYFLTVNISDGGEITLMQYLNGETTYFSKNKYYWSARELPVNEKVIWENRKFINRFIRSLVK